MISNAQYIVLNSKSIQIVPVWTACHLNLASLYLDAAKNAEAESRAIFYRFSTDFHCFPTVFRLFSPLFRLVGQIATRLSHGRRPSRYVFTYMYN